MPTDSMLTVFPILLKKAENLHNCYKLSKFWRNYQFLFFGFLIVKYFILVKTNYFIYITDIMSKSWLNMCSGLIFPLPLGGWNVTGLVGHQIFILLFTQISMPLETIMHIIVRVLIFPVSLQNWHQTINWTAKLETDFEVYVLTSITQQKSLK
jgi:hypothetical protein